MEMFISFFTGKVMLFYGISLIMKEKSNASALTWDETQSNAGRDAIERGRAFADKYRDCDENMQIRNTKHGARNDVPPDL